MNPHTSTSSNDTELRWQALKHLAPYIWAYRYRVGFALTLLLIAKLANVGVPLTLKRIIDSLDPNTATDALIAVPVSMLLAYGVLRFSAVAFGELRDAVFGKVAERTLSKISQTLLNHLHTLDLAFHLDRETGGLSRDLERGNAGISFLLRAIVFSVVPVFIEVLLVAGILAKLANPLYSLVVIGGVVAYVVFSIWMTNKRTQFIRQANVHDSSANTVAVDSLLNFETVKYFNNEHYEVERYGTRLKSREKAKLKNHFTLALLNSGQALIIASSVTIVMVLAAFDVEAGKLTLGDLAMVNAFLIQVFIPLNILGFIYREIRKNLADVEAMFDLLEVKPSIYDKENAQQYQASKDDINFRNVDFFYHSDRQILHGINLEIKHGEKVAIVGSSGSGKSTLARLLFRFYDVSSGSIDVGQHDIRDLSLDSWRCALGIVPQDTVLFNTTIRENLLYGKPDASEEQLANVIEQAQLSSFIEQLPNGLDTKVGERGLKVSGGEKQRIAIARVLLKAPHILVFDEATSALDSRSEKAIQQALDEISSHQTTLIIAHRLATVVNADKIVVLEAGRIVEQGSHQDLLAKNGHYAKLWKMQQQQPDETID